MFESFPRFNSHDHLRSSSFTHDLPCTAKPLLPQESFKFWSSKEINLIDFEAHVNISKETE